MGNKRHTAEEIVSKLRQVDVLTAQGRPVAEAVRQIGVTEVTYYRWRSEYGGLKLDQVKRLKELETENTRLRKAVSDLMLDGAATRPAASQLSAQMGGSQSSRKAHLRWTRPLAVASAPGVPQPRKPP